MSDAMTVQDDAAFAQLRSRHARNQFLMRYAILAPSVRNTQPWRFEVSDRGVRLYVDRSRRVPVVDPDERELYMSAGAAVMNLRVAAAHFGYHCAVLYDSSAPDRDLIASVDLFEATEVETVDEELKELFAAIPERHTNRQKFETRALEEDAIEALEKLPMVGQARLRVISAESTRDAIAQLIAVGDRMQMRDSDFRRELSEWLAPPSRPDGLPMDAVGTVRVLGGMTPWAVRTLDLSADHARHSHFLARTAPAMILIESPDDRVSLLQAGELLEHLLLKLVNLGLQYSFLNQAIEVPGLRPRLRSLLAVPAQPQLLIRVGYGRPVQIASRRRDFTSFVRTSGAEL